MTTADDALVLTTKTSAREAPPWQIWGALLIVYVVWGSTYLGIRIVIETMPPLLSLGLRFGVAALIMGAFLAVRKGPRVLRISRAELSSALLIGVLLLGVGNGGVMLGEQTVPSGLAALIIGVIPLVVLVMRRLMGETIGRTQLIGVAGGLCGLIVLIVPLGIGGSVAPGGIAILLLSTIGWAYGSVISGRRRLPRVPFVTTFYQFLAGCLFGLVAAGLTGELHGVDPSTWSARSLIAMAYLIVFGSLIAFSAFTWLLQHAPVSRVTTYAYVNPVVAVFLGWFVLGEDITLTMIVGAVLILASVALIVRRQRPATPTPEPG